jgi:hypothetical protein
MILNNVLIINEAFKLEAQEDVCYAKLMMMMMMIYLAYNMNIAEKMRKFLQAATVSVLVLHQ